MAKIRDKAKRTQELLDSQLNFDKLMEPYREAGVGPEQGATRTIGGIFDYLLNKKRYPKEIVGAAVLSVFLELKAGRKFEGDGRYGSAGRQLVQYIKECCEALNRKRLEDEAVAYAKHLFEQYKAAMVTAQRTFRQKLTNWSRYGAWR